MSRNAASRIKASARPGPQTRQKTTRQYLEVGTTSSTDPSWAVTLKATLASSNFTYANTYTVPTGAGYTDGTACGANITAWLATKADGASSTVHNKIVFPSGYTYTFNGDGTDANSGGLIIDARNNLTFDCTGATFDNTSPSPTQNYANSIFIRDSSYIRILNPNIVQHRTNMGTDAQAAQDNEKLQGVAVYAGCSYIEVSGATMTAIRGWPYLIAGDNFPKTLSHHIWIHGGGRHTGAEMFFATVGGEYVILEDTGPFEDATWYAIDFEPDTYRGDVNHYLIQRNTFARWGYRGAGHADYFLALTKNYSGPPYHNQDDVIVRDNVITAGAIHGDGGLSVLCTSPHTKSNVVITGNVSSAARTNSGGGMDFDGVTNLTVTSNTQATSGHVALVDTDTNPAGVHTVTPNTV